MLFYLKQLWSEIGSIIQNTYNKQEMQKQKT
jgi:hypothetical protein